VLTTPPKPYIYNVDLLMLLVELTSSSTLIHASLLTSMTMSSTLLKAAALFGVAAYACDGPSHQFQKRADSAIGMFRHDNIINTTPTNNDSHSMVLRRKSRLGHALPRLRALPSRHPTSPDPPKLPTRPFDLASPHPQLQQHRRGLLLQLGLRSRVLTLQSAVHLRLDRRRLPRGL
jgi:hypothetical protein